jgi:hypothetical protein
MWQHTYEEHTDLPPTAIWRVLSDIASWPETDANIAKIEVTGTPGLGTRFFLTPKGGPRLGFVVGDFLPPSLYSDVCKMPFASMKTRHLLIAKLDEPTLVRVEIEIRGPLAWLWGRVVGRKHASGLPAQTANILQRARQLDLKLKDA